jgi:putative transposase
MLISIPQKYPVANVIGYIEGKSAIHIATTYFGLSKYSAGQHFWAKRFHVSTAGRDEEVIRRYIKEQKTEDRRPEELNLFK